MEQELNYNERKEWARTLFVKNDKPISEIALTVGVNEATVRSWVRDGEWNAVKRSLLISRNTQLEHFYRALENLNERLKDGENPSVKDVDLYVKYTNSINNLQETTSIATIVEVSELFSSWLLRRDLVLAKKFTLLLDNFIKQRMAA